jgi:hypothetical protein
MNLHPDLAWLALRGWQNALPRDRDHGIAGRAMSALTVAARGRLAGFLNRLGGADPVDRDLAGRAAHQLVSDAGLTWAPIVRPPPIEKPIAERGRWRATARTLLERPQALSPWDRCFLDDVTGFRRLSTKQRYVLKSIAGRVMEIER